MVESKVAPIGVAPGLLSNTFQHLTKIDLVIKIKYFIIKAEYNKIIIPGKHGGGL